jgi:hypothetical protein
MRQAVDEVRYALSGRNILERIYLKGRNQILGAIRRRPYRDDRVESSTPEGGVDSHGCAKCLNIALFDAKAYPHWPISDPKVDDIHSYTSVASEEPVEIVGFAIYSPIQAKLAATSKMMHQSPKPTVPF